MNVLYKYLIVISVRRVKQVPCFKMLRQEKKGKEKRRKKEKKEENEEKGREQELLEESERG